MCIRDSPVFRTGISCPLTCLSGWGRITDSISANRCGCEFPIRIFTATIFISRASQSFVLQDKQIRNSHNCPCSDCLTCHNTLKPVPALRNGLLWFMTTGRLLLQNIRDLFWFTFRKNKCKENHDEARKKSEKKPNFFSEYNSFCYIHLL